MKKALKAVKEFVLKLFDFKLHKAEPGGVQVDKTLMAQSATLAKHGLPMKNGRDSIEDMLGARVAIDWGNGIRNLEVEIAEETPILSEKTRQFEEDRKNEKQDIIEARKQAQSDLQMDMQHSQKRSAIRLKFKEEQLQIAKPQAERSKAEYVEECKKLQAVATWQKAKRIPKALMYAAVVLIMGIETVANFQAFLKTMGEDVISSGLMALGTAFGASMLAKIGGKILGSMSVMKTRKWLPILSASFLLLFGFAFCFLIGGTRIDAGNIDSSWAKYLVFSLNSFLFLCTVVIAWFSHTTNSIAVRLNPLLDRAISDKNLVASLQAEIDGIKLTEVEDEIVLEHSYREKVQQINPSVRNAAIEIAQQQGKHNSKIASIYRSATIFDANMRELIHGVRMANWLAREDPSEIPDCHQSEPHFHPGPLFFDPQKPHQFLFPFTTQSPIS